MGEVAESGQVPSVLCRVRGRLAVASGDGGHCGNVVEEARPGLG